MNKIDQKNVGVSTKTVLSALSSRKSWTCTSYALLSCRRGNVHMAQCIAAPSIFATGIGGLAVKGEEEDHQGPGGQPGTILRGSTGVQGVGFPKVVGHWAPPEAA